MLEDNPWSGLTPQWLNIYIGSYTNICMQNISQICIPFLECACVSLYVFLVCVHVWLCVCFWLCVCVCLFVCMCGYLGGALLITETRKRKAGSENWDINFNLRSLHGLLNIYRGIFDKSLRGCKGSSNLEMLLDDKDWCKPPPYNEINHRDESSLIDIDRY